MSRGADVGFHRNPRSAEASGHLTGFLVVPIPKAKHQADCRLLERHIKCVRSYCRDHTAHAAESLRSCRYGADCCLLSEPHRVGFPHYSSLKAEEEKRSEALKIIQAQTRDGPPERIRGEGCAVLLNSSHRSQTCQSEMDSLIGDRPEQPPNRSSTKRTASISFECDGFKSTA